MIPATAPFKITCNIFSDKAVLSLLRHITPVYILSYQLLSCPFQYLLFHLVLCVCITGTRTKISLIPFSCFSYILFSLPSYLSLSWASLSYPVILLLTLSTFLVLYCCLFLSYFSLSVPFSSYPFLLFSMYSFLSVDTFFLFFSYLTCLFLSFPSLSFSFL